MKNTRNRLTRRRFVSGISSAAALAAFLPRHTITAGPLPPSERLRLAFVGVGGRGRRNLEGLDGLGHEVVALCDVDSERAKESFARFSTARRFVDYRKMLDAIENDIDGVVVSTPDHTHAVAAIDASSRSGVSASN